MRLPKSNQPGDGLMLRPEPVASVPPIRMVVVGESLPLWGSMVGVRLTVGHTVLIESLLLFVGLVLLTVAADHLVFGSSRIATRLP